jgi:hypothetical protein
LKHWIYWAVVGNVVAMPTVDLNHFHQLARHFHLPTQDRMYNYIDLDIKKMKKKERKKKAFFYPKLSCQAS